MPPKTIFDKNMNMNVTAFRASKDKSTRNSLKVSKDSGISNFSDQ